MATDVGVNKLAIRYLMTTDLESTCSDDEGSWEGRHEELSKSAASTCTSAASALNDAPIQESLWRFECFVCSM